jgi:uncharacterized membrane protein
LLLVLLGAGLHLLIALWRRRSGSEAGPRPGSSLADVLGRFFQAVLVASLLTLASGVWMLGRVAKQVVQSGGSFEMPLAWTVMAVLGVAMVAIFMHIRFVLFKRLGRAVAASEWAAGGAALAQIRTWVSINLGLGVLVLLVTLMRWTT